MKHFLILTAIVTATISAPRVWSEQGHREPPQTAPLATESTGAYRAETVRAAIQQSKQFKPLAQQANQFAQQQRQTALTAANRSELKKQNPLSAPNGILVFTSLTLADRTLKQQLQQSASLQVPLIIQGVLAQGFAATTRRISSLIGLKLDAQGQASYQVNAGFAIAPEWFNKFNINAVPAMVAIKAGKCGIDEPCQANDYDVLYGNISLHDALAIIAEQGDARQIAKRVLQTREEE